MKTLNDIFTQLQPLFILACSYGIGLLFIHLFRPYLTGKARPDTPERHQSKQPALTAGGIYFLTMIVGIGIIWFALTFDWKIAQLLVSLLLFGGIGLLDDVQKLRVGRGISARAKFILQILAGLVVIIPFWHGHSMLIPFYGTLQLPQLISMAWCVFIIIACSNAVNLTDGLDGLATASFIPNLFLLSTFASIYAYQDVSLFLIQMAAVLCGFLLLNWFPARLIMGDVGALALGACYGTTFLMMGLEFLIPIAGFVYFFEEVSVMLQIFSYRTRKKRIFKMAPFHHHLELSGMHEIAIALLATAISIIGCAVAYLVFSHTPHTPLPL